RYFRRTGFGRSAYWYCLPMLRNARVVVVKDGIRQHGEHLLRGLAMRDVSSNEGQDGRRWSSHNLVRDEQRFSLRGRDLRVGQRAKRNILQSPFSPDQRAFAVALGGGGTDPHGPNLGARGLVSGVGEPYPCHSLLRGFPGNARIAGNQKLVEPAAGCFHRL